MLIYLEAGLSIGNVMESLQWLGSCGLRLIHLVYQYVRWVWVIVGQITFEFLDHFIFY
jgi:hypothetical protein